jgi:hypothetical protein
MLSQTLLHLAAGLDRLRQSGTPLTGDGLSLAADALRDCGLQAAALERAGVPADIPTADSPADAGAVVIPITAAPAPGNGPTLRLIKGGAA